MASSVGDGDGRGGQQRRAWETVGEEEDDDRGEADVFFLLRTELCVLQVVWRAQANRVLDDAR